MLRDRLVCGVRHNGIQNKLLSEKNLTYDRVFELAQSIEDAENDTGTSRAAAVKATIHFVFTVFIVPRQEHSVFREEKR